MYWGCLLCPLYPPLIPTVSIHFWHSISFEMFFSSLFVSTTSSAENQPPFMESVSRRLYLQYCILYVFFSSRLELPYWARSKRAWERTLHRKRGKPGLQCMEWCQTQWKREQKKSKQFNELMDFSQSLTMDSLLYTWSILRKFKHNSPFLRWRHTRCASWLLHCQISNRGGLSMSHLLWDYRH